MSIQSIRPVGAGISAAQAAAQAAAAAAQAAQAAVPRQKDAVRRRSDEDQNVFSPPGVMSRLVRSMRADEVIRPEAVTRGSELSASKGYPSDTVVNTVAAQILGGQ
jgi:hypothetical protein